MTIVRFDQVSLRFGEQVILREADFSVEPGERVCLIGRNGAGKTSLLRLISGQYEPDHGEVRFRADVSISQLEQTPPETIDQTVREAVTSGLAQLQALCDEYDRRSRETLDAKGMRELEELQHRIDAAGGWVRFQSLLEVVRSVAERHGGALGT